MSSHFKPNFKTDTDVKFNKYGLAVFNACTNLFSHLPLATIVQNAAGYRLYVTHGGISDRLSLTFAQSVDRRMFPSVNMGKANCATPDRKAQAEALCDMLWSDPITAANTKSTGGSLNGCFPNKARNLGWYFGEDVTDRFCKRHNFNAVVRSHEVRKNGFAQDQKHCYTIFSSSYYCKGKNKAAVIILEADRKNIEYRDFRTQSFSVVDEKNDKQALLASFKKVLDMESASLLEQFAEEDAEGEGSISLDEWSSIISKHLAKSHDTLIAPEHLVTLKDYLCPCNEEDQTAEYANMFVGEEHSQAGSMVSDMLEVIFEFIDLDKDGQLSAEEAGKAIELINSTLGKTYDADFLKNLDEDGDGEISMEEFRNAFLKNFG